MPGNEKGAPSDLERLGAGLKDADRTLSSLVFNVSMIGSVFKG
jgi:hypothetical protein